VHCPYYHHKLGFTGNAVDVNTGSDQVTMDWMSMIRKILTKHNLILNFKHLGFKQKLFGLQYRHIKIFKIQIFHLLNQPNFSMFFSFDMKSENTVQKVTESEKIVTVPERSLKTFLSL
jgi:hypothetical protein